MTKLKNYFTIGVEFICQIILLIVTVIPAFIAFQSRPVDYYSEVNFAIPGLIYFSIWGFFFRKKYIWATNLVLILFTVALFAFQRFQVSFFIPILAAYFGKYLGLTAKEGIRPPLAFSICALSLLVLTPAADYLNIICPTGGYGQDEAKAKESASNITGAFSVLQQSRKLSPTLKPNDFIPFINYVSTDTSSKYVSSLLEQFRMQWIILRDKIWTWQGRGTSECYLGAPLQQCSDKLPCLKLHNGGILQYDSEQGFGGSSSTNAIFFNFDPDADGPAGRISFYQFYNGRLTPGEVRGPSITKLGTMTSQDKDPVYLQNWN